MELRAPFESIYLHNHCLTFLLVGSPFSEPEPGSVSPVPVPLSYSLETGRLWWRRPISGDRMSVSLRDNARLAEAWEPMTVDKLAVAALELGVVGDKGVPHPVIEPGLAAVVVSPDGFVTRWRHGNHVEISDIGRLANNDRSLISAAGDWNRYQISPGGEVHGPGLLDKPLPAAMVGNGRNPVPDGEWQIRVPTLADCAAAMAAPIEESGNQILAEFTPETAQFVHQQFGLDVGFVDWQEARKTRIINRRFSSTAGFDTPTTACAVLRLAALSAQAQAATPTPLIGGPSRDQVQRVQRQLPTRPGM